MSNRKHSKLYYPTHLFLLERSLFFHSGPLREGWEQGILPRGPQTIKGPNEAFIFMIFTFMGCIFTIFRFPLHPLDSVSEHWGTIISNAFKVCTSPFLGSPWIGLDLPTAINPHQTFLIITSSKYT